MTYLKNLDVQEIFWTS